MNFQNTQPSSSMECNHTVITCYDDEIVSIPPKMTTLDSLPKHRYQTTAKAGRTSIKCIILFSLCIVLLICAYGVAFVNFTMYLFRLEVQYDRENADLIDQRDEMWIKFHEERIKIQNLVAAVQNFDIEFGEN